MSCLFSASSGGRLCGFAASGSDVCFPIIVSSPGVVAACSLALKSPNVMQGPLFLCCLHAFPNCSYMLMCFPCGSICLWNVCCNDCVLWGLVDCWAHSSVRDGFNVKYVF